MGTLLEDTAAAVAAALGLDPSTPTPRVTAASEAALELARTYIDPVPIEAPADPLEGVPDTALVRAGLTATAVRIYQDPASPAGVLGSEAYTGAYLPEDLLAHVHHYFDPYRARSSRGIL